MVENSIKEIGRIMTNSDYEYLSGEPIYTEFLSKIKGMGKVLSTNLIKEFGDGSKYGDVSKLWAHSGNDGSGEKAPRRRKGTGISCSPILRALTWKLSNSLLKSNKGYYRNIYDMEKEKGLNVTYEEGVLKEKYGKPYKKMDVALSRGHAHNRALREMRKHFLSRFWGASRELNGLPTNTVYVEGVLQHNHIFSWRDIVKMEEQAKKEQGGKKI